MINALPAPFGELVLPVAAPAWLFLCGSLLTIVFRRWRRLQLSILLGLPVLGAINLLALDAGTYFIHEMHGVELVHLRVDRLSLLFGLLFHIGTLTGFIYALRTADTTQHVAALFYAGSALGAVFAGDLITLFCYWEGMAISSAFLVWAGGTPQSRSAGMRYLLMHLVSGLLLLAGAMLIYHSTGRLQFDFIGTDSLAGTLIVLAFGIKCGFPFLHTWITDGYPAATPSGAVFLSMFTTKVAVYALARGFPGTDILIPVGTAMALFPIFYAVIENDLRRVLGYSMINQIGFMVVGIGIGTELALNGAVAHAFNEVLFKGLLFMTMGAVLLRSGHVLGSDLGGLYRSMPWTTAFCVVGAASISAFPLFNGFVSKSMIMAALIEDGSRWAWLGLLFASAGVFHHAGIKIPFFAFFAHDNGLRVAEAPRNMLIAMALAAALCIITGSYPALLYALLPWDAAYAPYTYPHVIVQLQLLLFSALAFAWLKLTGIYPPELRSLNLDADWLWRDAGARLVAATLGLPGRLSPLFRPWQRALAGWRDRATASGNTLVRTSESGTALLLVGILLVIYLLLYYLKVD